jgi:hypothetical protein
VKRPRGVPARAPVVRASPDGIGSFPYPEKAVPRDIARRFHMPGS